MATIGQAIAHMQDGGKAAREGWNGKGMFIFILHVITSSAGYEYTISPCIAMKTANDDIQPGWLASQADLLANDWILLN